MNAQQIVNIQQLKIAIGGVPAAIADALQLVFMAKHKQPLCVVRPVWRARRRRGRWLGLEKFVNE